MKHILIAFTLLLGANLVAHFANASIDVFDFSNEQTQERYNELTKILRCPKCQNQDIADSNAPIAKDMRREVYRLVEQDYEVDDVVAHMVERFGDFVSYKPKLDTSTFLLWFGPFVFIVLGLFVVVLLAVKRKTSVAAQQTQNMVDSQSVQVHQQVADLLQQYDDQPSTPQAPPLKDNVNSAEVENTVKTDQRNHD